MRRSMLSIDGVARELNMHYLPPMVFWEQSDGKQKSNEIARGSRRRQRSMCHRGRRTELQSPTARPLLTITAAWRGAARRGAPRLSH